MAAEGNRKILVAIDGSEQSDYAFQWYLDNMKQDNDYVYGVLVQEYSLTGVTVGPFSDPSALTKQFQEQHQATEKLTADHTAKLRTAQVKGQCDSFAGDKPGNIICEQVEKLGIDAVIMGTRGRGAIKSALMGSVSNFVSQNSGVPVSVIPMKKTK